MSELMILNRFITNPLNCFAIIEYICTYIVLMYSTKRYKYIFITYIIVLKESSMIKDSFSTNSLNSFAVQESISKYTYIFFRFCFARFITSHATTLTHSCQVHTLKHTYVYQRVNEEIILCYA